MHSLWMRFYSPSPRSLIRAWLFKYLKAGLKNWSDCKHGSRGRSTRPGRLSYKTSTYSDIRPRELAAEVKERKKPRPSRSCPGMTPLFTDDIFIVFFGGGVAALLGMKRKSSKHWSYSGQKAWKFKLGYWGRTQNKKKFRLCTKHKTSKFRLAAEAQTKWKQFKMLVCIR